MLHHGRIVEVGTHDALLAADGRYAALWRVQTGASSAAEERTRAPAPG